jgi:hypothetical protein
MAINMKDFVGRWQVQWVDGDQPFLQKGWILEIGTSNNSSLLPFLTGEYQIATGFSVLSSLDPPTAELSSSDKDEYNQPLALLLGDEGLRWEGWYKGQRLSLVISLAQTKVPGGDTYKSLYGSTTYGDPDQVAVWGANGTAGGGGTGG